MMRALEVVMGTGRSLLSFQQSAKKTRDFSIIHIGLSLPREDLYRNINTRVDSMVTDGLEAEARALLPARHFNALQTVGYQELFDYLDGKTDFATAVSLVKRNTRHYAKRQMTWFRKDASVKWFLPTEFDTLKSYLKHYLQQE
jgi:tRNA dimethylallyltransferase